MKMHNNTTIIEIHDKYDVEPTVACFKLRLIGVYCLILFIVSAIFNSALLFAFIKHKSLRTSLNMFIMALTAFNLFGTLVELPFIVISNLYCKYKLKFLNFFSFLQTEIYLYLFKMDFWRVWLYI